MERRVVISLGVVSTTLPGFAVLNAVANDLESHEVIFRNYERTRLNESSTPADVARAIRAWHGVLRPGDTFVFAYAGHGTQVPGGPDEPVREALVLHDALLIDRDLRELLHGFDTEVNVVALIDACHASGAAFAFPPELVPGLPLEPRRFVAGNPTFTIAAAPEDANAYGRPDEGGLLTSALLLAVTNGLPTTWADVWNQTSGWALAHAMTHVPGVEFAARVDAPTDDTAERLLAADAHL